jgi:hypothetical protein
MRRMLAAAPRTSSLSPGEVTSPPDSLLPPNVAPWPAFLSATALLVPVGGGPFRCS